jgi:hypothetical protein
MGVSAVPTRRVGAPRFRVGSDPEIR